MRSRKKGGRPKTRGKDPHDLQVTLDGSLWRIVQKIAAESGLVVERAESSPTLRLVPRKIDEPREAGGLGPERRTG